VAVRFGNDSILVWGGYKESHDDDNFPPEHEYWSPNLIW
jgi:hypothetical protein